MDPTNSSPTTAPASPAPRRSGLMEFVRAMAISVLMILAIILGLMLVFYVAGLFLPDQFQGRK